MAQIQPSQSYVDKDKILSVSNFIHKPEDVIIQVLSYKERYISLDGHTRLYYAVTKGWNSVYAVEEKYCSVVRPPSLTWAKSKPLPSICQMTFSHTAS